MKFQNTIDFIVEELSELNSILKKNNINKTIDINTVVENIIEREKNNRILKYNVKHSESKLEENIDLLKSKLDLEYQIYNILVEHRTRIKKLQEENDLPEINDFIEKMFDISCSSVLSELTDCFSGSQKPLIPQRTTKSTLKKASPKAKSPPTNPPPAPKFNAMDLQSQLSAAIASRKERCDNN